MSVNADPQAVRQVPPMSARIAAAEKRAEKLPQHVRALAKRLTKAAVQRGCENDAETRLLAGHLATVTEAIRLAWAAIETQRLADRSAIPAELARLERALHDDARELHLGPLDVLLFDMSGVVTSAEATLAVWRALNF